MCYCTMSLSIYSIEVCNSLWFAEDDVKDWISGIPLMNMFQNNLKRIHIFIA